MSAVLGSSSIHSLKSAKYYDIILTSPRASSKENTLGVRLLAVAYRNFGQTSSVHLIMSRGKLGVSELYILISSVVAAVFLFIAS
jgi:hypothetical protein